MQLRSRKRSLLSPAEPEQTHHPRQTSEPDREAAKHPSAGTTPDAQPAAVAQPDTAGAAPEQQETAEIRDNASAGPPLRAEATDPAVQRAAAVSDSQRPQRCHIVLSSASTAGKRPPSPAIVLSATVGPQAAACRSSSRLRKAVKAKPLLATTPAAGATGAVSSQTPADAHTSRRHGPNAQVSCSAFRMPDAFSPTRTCHCETCWLSCMRL